MMNARVETICLCTLSLFIFCNQFVVYVDSKPVNNTNQNTSNHNGSEKNEPHRHEQKIKVAKLDFEHIARPFIITVWVLLATLLKVGTFIGFNQIYLFNIFCFDLYFP